MCCSLLTGFTSTVHFIFLLPPIERVLLESLVVIASAYHLCSVHVLCICVFFVICCVYPACLCGRVHVLCDQEHAFPLLR